jgi:hypothetical protein
MNAVRIRTRYVSPTDTRGARIRATGGGRSLTVPYDHSASNAHLPAAEALAAVLGADGVRQVEYRTVKRYGVDTFAGYVYETV